MARGSGTRRTPAAARATELTIQEALRHCMQQAPLPFAITRGAEHTLVYANSAFCRLAGFEDDALGTPIINAFPAPGRPALTSILDRASQECVEILDERLGHSLGGATGLQCSVWPVIAHDRKCEALGIEIRHSSPSDVALELQRQISEQMLLGALRERGFAEDAEAANQ